MTASVCRIVAPISTHRPSTSTGHVTDKNRRCNDNQGPGRTLDTPKNGLPPNKNQRWERSATIEENKSHHAKVCDGDRVQQ